MTEQLRASEPTAGEIEEQTPEGEREMAAARAMVRAVSLMNEAVKASGKSYSDIADALGVTVGRVSQVLSGDGNVRLSTLARYLRAAGFVTVLGAENVDPDGPAIGRGRSRRHRESPTSLAVYAARVKHGNDMGFRVVVMSEGTPITAERVSPYQSIGWTSSSPIKIDPISLTSSAKT